MSLPQAGLIHLEIREVSGDRYLGSVNVPQVPVAGEIIRYDGRDYAIINRRWAAENHSDVLYCYLLVAKP